MSKINIIGLGPGNKDYILPIATKEIKNSDVIIGAKRNIDSLNIFDKEVLIIKSNLEEVIDYLNKNKNNKKISVVVSGDTGFYSLLRFIKRYISLDELNIIPGISSMQYMFAKIGQTYEDAILISLHGRNNDFVEKAKKYKLVGILTDKTWTSSLIAKTLKDNNIKINEKDMVKVYYGNGINSLNTAPQGTSAAKVFDIINAYNVIPDTGTKGRVDISLEQIISYDPEIMIINGEPKQQLTGSMAVEEIMNNVDFSNITAVKNSKVYATPKVPFSWFDRPSGPNRIIGIVWLSELVYPSYYDFDIKTEVKEFYKLFYHLNLCDEDLDDIIFK